MTAVVLDRPVVAPIAAPATDDPDRLVIVVGQTDIDKGDQGIANWCAIAIAARRQGREGWWSMGTDGTLEFLPEARGMPREYWFSDEAGRFANAFDRDRGSVHPERFVFTRVSRAG